MPSSFASCGDVLNQVIDPDVLGLGEELPDAAP
jgi:hypothetical protein